MQTGELLWRHLVGMGYPFIGKQVDGLKFYRGIYGIYFIWVFFGRWILYTGIIGYGDILSFSPCTQGDKFAKRSLELIPFGFLASRSKFQ